MMGGINLAQEYMGPTPDPNRWLDLSVVIEGPVVGPISTLFRDDWDFAAKQQAGPCPKVDPGLSYLGETDVPTAAQLVASGPDVEGDPFYETVLAAIYGAARRVWVVTPYFVPDQSIAQALELASRRGIDVRLIVPEHSNHLMADIARNSYLKQVAASGAKVLLYERGMVHAKTIVIDDDLAIVGSANIDMRSLFLNYEAALFLSSMESVTEVADWIQALFVDCKHSVPKQGPVRDLAEGVVRLIAPLL
jgi:cardiolipin synthase